MKKSCLFYFFALCLFPQQIFAQTIQGKVVDEKTGGEISFISIGIIGTNEAAVFAESSSNSTLSINNQSFLTFIFSGALLPEEQWKFVNLATLDEFEVNVDRFIAQADQNIAVVSCDLESSFIKMIESKSAFGTMINP